MAEQKFDLIVVGGGPGGYVAAIRAAQLKMNVALVEREHLGGICLNWGCIPTKALLRSSEISHLLRHLDAYGFRADNISFDLKKVVDRSRKVAAQLSGGVKHLLKKNKVTVFDGHGKLAGTAAGGLRKLAVAKDGKPLADLVSKHIILATGARARCRGSSPTASSSGPTRRRWCRRSCRSRCWWSARVRSGSSLRASFTTWGPR